MQLVVKSTRLNQILDYSPSDLVVTVQPGVSLASLQAVLAAQGQMLPIDPVCFPNSTIGGILSTGVTGPLRTLYGTLRDLTIGLRTVYPNGEIIKTGGKVVKNVAGYDMTKLFIGSLGTLAFITEISFKLRPLPKHAELCLLSGSAEQVSRATAEVMNSTLIPGRLEALCSADPMGQEDRMEHSAKPWVLAIESHDDPRAAASQSASVERLARACGLECRILRGDEVQTFWDEYRTSLAQMSLRLRYTIPPNQAIARSEQVSRFLANFPGATYTSFSVTPIAGVSRLYASGLSVDEQVQVVSFLRAAVASDQGNVVIENGSAELRSTIDAFGATDADVTLHRHIKTAIDPQNTMNPGRFVGGI